LRMVRSLWHLSLLLPGLGRGWAHNASLLSS
jgi:hypothetical protein